jgi:hypothetical protein
VVPADCKEYNHDSVAASDAEGVLSFALNKKIESATTAITVIMANSGTKNLRIIEAPFS